MIIPITKTVTQNGGLFFDNLALVRDIHTGQVALSITTTVRDTSNRDNVLDRQIISLTGGDCDAFVQANGPALLTYLRPLLNLPDTLTNEMVISLMLNSTPAAPDQPSNLPTNPASSPAS